MLLEAAFTSIFFAEDLSAQRILYAVTDISAVIRRTKMTREINNLSDSAGISNVTGAGSSLLKNCCKLIPFILRNKTTARAKTAIIAKLE